MFFALGHRTSFKSRDYLFEGVRALKMFIVAYPQRQTVDWSLADLDR